METVILGTTAVFLGGLLNGTFAYLMKLVRRRRWENIWLLFFGLVLFPIAVAFGTIDGLWQVYRTIPDATLTSTVALGVAWGCGSLLFGLGISALGFSLGCAIVMGTTAVFGTLIPALALSPSMLIRQRGVTLLASIGLILNGLALCTIAGRMRDRTASTAGGSSSYQILTRKHFRNGLALCTGSGLLSACFNIGFAMAADIITAAQRAGASPANAGSVAWALIMPSGMMPSLAYCAYLMFGNRSFGNLCSGWRNWLLALLMACFWVFAIRLYGFGTYYARGPRCGDRLAGDDFVRHYRRQRVGPRDRRMALGRLRYSSLSIRRHRLFDRCGDTCPAAPERSEETGKKIEAQ